MPLEPTIIQRISAEVYRKYPAVNSSKPKIKPYTDGQYLLIFQGSGRAANGAIIETTVRAVASESGKIIKLSASKG
ncbi:MAG: hypothetical protein IT308_01940 [Anaerolineaceae bacterium]|nr:hypothetical protein [Anaerolineaceae bacterium]